MHFIILTNSKAPLKLEESNRRYNLFDVDNTISTDFMSLPEIVRANTNAPIVMIAEKAADIIKNH